MIIFISSEIECNHFMVNIKFYISYMFEHGEYMIMSFKKFKWRCTMYTLNVTK
jgi:hypothetical protein